MLAISKSGRPTDVQQTTLTIRAPVGANKEKKEEKQRKERNREKKIEKERKEGKIREKRDKMREVVRKRQKKREK